jgi:hypothetical protein
MSTYNIRTPRHALFPALSLAAALAGAVLAWPEAGLARHQESAFALFAGSWRGAGRVVTQDGREEAINCRARNDVSEAGTNFSQALVCASDSYRFDIRTTAVSEGGNVTGNWQETTRGVGGQLKGQVANGAFEGSVDGPGFTASIAYRSNGRAQTVVIGVNAGGIARVEVSLKRGG